MHGTSKCRARVWPISFVCARTATVAPASGSANTKGPAARASTCSRPGYSLKIKATHMTAKDLIDVVERGDKSAVEIALSRLTEDERKAVADSRELSNWIDSKLKEVSWRLEWECILPLVNAGCVSPVSSDGVLKSLVYGLWYKHYYNHGETLIADDLINEPELMEGLYRLFDIETNAFDGYAGDQEHVGSSWPRTLIDLCDQGRLDRPAFWQTVFVDYSILSNLKRSIELSGSMTILSLRSKNGRLLKKSIYRCSLVRLLRLSASPWGI